MTQPPYDVHAPKKASNLSVNADLLAQARELGINLSRVFEERLAEIVVQARREQWLEDNRDAIQDYNQRIINHGSYGDGVHRF